MNHNYVLRLFCAILLLAYSINFFGQNIYISPGGNDNNPGTEAMPLATLTAARDKAREIRKSSKISGPLEIIISGGDYFLDQPLELTHEDAGTKESPLVFKTPQGEKSIFRGGVKITGWEKVNDSLWRAFIPQVAYYNSYFEQLFVNGKRATRARTPNEGFYVVKNVSETNLEKGPDPHNLYSVQEVFLDSADAQCFNTFSADDFQDALITFYHKWDNTRKHIRKYNGNSSSVFFDGKSMQPWNRIDSISRYFIDNFKAALDAPGEWYLERNGYLYYIPLPGETLENLSVYAPVLDKFVVITGEEPGKKVEHVRFENLTFQVAAYHTPAEGNEPAQAASPVGAAITLDHASNISFLNCEVAHTGTYAFWFRQATDNCHVSHCYMHDLGAGGVKIGETFILDQPQGLTRNIIIENNIIRDGGHVFPCAVGVIIFNASNNAIMHNDIASLRYSGISVGWVWGYSHSPSKRNFIAFNHIHHLGWGELCDMGGIYTLGPSEGTIISNNVIHHVYSFNYGGWGLYTDEGSTGIVLENNLVYECKSSGFNQHYGKENIVRNNIFALNLRSQLSSGRIEQHRSVSFTNNIVYFNNGTLMSDNWHRFDLYSDYNLYWDVSTKNIHFNNMTFSEWQKTGKDQHSIIADPGFVDPLLYDFHAKNKGILKKINFQAFDYEKAGVYGEEEWKRLAETDLDIITSYDEKVALLEKN